jgi:membrane protein
MKAIFDALNIVYDEEEKRSFAKPNALSLAFTPAALDFPLLALAAVVVLPIALEFVGLGGGVKGLLVSLPSRSRPA